MLQDKFRHGNLLSGRSGSWNMRPDGDEADSWAFAETPEQLISVHS